MIGLSAQRSGQCAAWPNSFFISGLMEAHLGRISGRSVRSGQIARGDVRRIDCALSHGDMRGSTELSQRLSPEGHVAALNRYFDCVAGAVLDFGGEGLSGTLAEPIFATKTFAAEGAEEARSRGHPCAARL